MQRVYSPQISPELVKKLYYLKQREGVPMTVLADRAISTYIAEAEQKGGDLHDRVGTSQKKTPKAQEAKITSP